MLLDASLLLFAVTDQPSPTTRSTSSFLLFGQVRALPWSFIRCPPWD
jgi:hypothetical protein